MDPKVLEVIKRIEREDLADREYRDKLRSQGKQQPPEEGWWALHPASAKLAHTIVVSAGWKNIMEVGVAHGYSTVWLADAAKTNGGKLIAFEIHEHYVEFTRANLADAGLSEYVEFVVGDAMKTLDEPREPADFIMLDCWDRLYPELLPHVPPVLRPGGLMCSDNVTAGNAESDHYRKLIAEHPDMDTLNVPIGRGGLEVSIKRLDAGA